MLGSTSTALVDSAFVNQDGWGSECNLPSWLSDSFCCDGLSLSDSSSTPYNTIAFMWTDLNPSSAGLYIMDLLMTPMQLCLTVCRLMAVHALSLWKCCFTQMAKLK